MQEIVLLTTIVSRSMGEKINSFYNENGLAVTLSSLGHGTASSEILDYLGLAETDKEILFTVTNVKKAGALVKGLIHKMRLDVPGNGIAFTIPISSIAGNATMKYLTSTQDLKGCEETMRQSQYELVVAITNRGYADQVMSAARLAKATGGTIIHAKGTGIEQAEKFFGVSIAAEKDMVFIVVKCNSKAEVMRSIVTNAGMQSKAKTMVFSLPVTDIAGLRIIDDEIVPDDEG